MALGPNTPLPGAPVVEPPAWEYGMPIPMPADFALAPIEIPPPAPSLIAPPPAFGGVEVPAPPPAPPPAPEPAPALAGPATTELPTPPPPPTGSFVGGVPLPPTAESAIVNPPPPQEIEFTPEQAEREETAARVRDYLALAPEQRAVQFGMEDMRRDEQRQSLEQDALRETHEREKVVEQEYRGAIARAKERQAMLDAESDALSRQPIEDKTWDQKLVGAIAVGLGAMFASQTGGANMALQILNNATDQAWKVRQEKRRDIERRQGAITADLQGAKDLFLEEQAFKIAAQKRALLQIDAEMQKYDPAGSTARKLVQIRDQVATAMTDAQRKAYDAALDREIKLGEYNLKLRDSARKDREQQLRASGAGRPDATLVSPLEAKERYGIEIAQPMKIGEINARLEAKKKTQDIAKDANTTGLSKEQLERTVPGLEIKVQRPDGSTEKQPFYAVGDASETKKLRSTVTSTKKLVRLMDEAIRLRTGWTSDTVKSPEWRRLKANWAAAIGEAKGEGQLALGVLTGPDMDLVGEFLGAKDPTEFRDPTAGILQARHNLIEAVNDAATGLAPPGASVVPFDIEPPKPPKIDKDDEAFKSAKKLDRDWRAEADRDWRASRQLDRSIPYPTDIVSPGNRSYLESLYAAATARGDGEEVEKNRSKAFVRLGDLAGDSDSGGSEDPSIRALAESFLSRAATENTLSEEH